MLDTVRRALPSAKAEILKAARPPALAWVRTAMRGAVIIVLFAAGYALDLATLRSVATILAVITAINLVASVENQFAKLALNTGKKLWGHEPPKPAKTPRSPRNYAEFKRMIETMPEAMEGTVRVQRKQDDGTLRFGMASLDPDGLIQVEWEDNYVVAIPDPSEWGKRIKMIGP